MTLVLGVDGYPRGWVVAAVGDDGRVDWHLLPTAREVLDLTAAAVGVDIPIGLPEAGRRECDALAAARLGPARSSVFTTPVRDVLRADTHAEAGDRNAAVTGQRISLQAFNILPKVRDMDDALGEPPDPRVVEVHPEVSFRLLSASVTAPKKSARGAGQRLAALRPWVDVDDALARVPSGPALDDALDALVAAWSARRWLTGAAVVLPANPPTDRRGRPMRIVG